MGKPSVWRLLPSVALATVAYTILSPLLPSLKADWFRGTCDEDEDPKCYLKHAQQVSGIVSSIRFMIVFSVSAYLGRLSDRIGRVPLLRLNNIGATLPVLALLFTNGESAEAYFVTYLVSGLVACGQFQTVAYAADCSEPDVRARNFGYLGAVQGLALILSPLLTAYTTSLTDNHLFLISSAILCANGLYIELFLPESLNLQISENLDPDETPGKESFFSSAALDLLKRNRTVAWLAVYILFTALPEQGVVEIVLIYLSDVLRLDGTEVRKFSSLYLSLTGVGIFVSQTLFMWVFMRLLKFGPIGLMFVATIANIAHMILYASLSTNHSEIVAFSNVLVTSFMFVGLPATNAMLSKQTEANEQGLAMGTLDSIRSLVGAFGPVFFSFLYSFFGTRNDFPEAPFLFGAAFASFALLVVLFPLRRIERLLSSEDIEIDEADALREQFISATDPA